MEDKTKLYLNMILAETEPLNMVRQCLDSVKDQVDGMYITVTYKDKEPVNSPLIQLLQTYKVKTSTFKWVDDFSAARNFSIAQVPQGKHNYIYWQDADDTLENSEKLHSITEEADKMMWSAVFFEYLYMVDWDEKGQIREILVRQDRERIIKNDGTFKWIGMLHETLIQQRQENVLKFKREECRVIHHTHQKRLDVNLERNIRILEKQAAKENHRDPRTLIYLAKAYYDKGKSTINSTERKVLFDLALTLFHEYLEGSGEPGQPGYSEGSGWREERATAYGYVADIALLSGALDVALAALDNAIEEGYEFPNYYVDKAMVYCMKKDFNRAKHWLMLATSVPEPDTTVITTPRDLKLRALECSFQINFNQMKLENALRDCESLLQVMPGDKGMMERLEMVKGIQQENRAAQSIIYLGKYLEKNKEDDTKLASLVKAIPKDLMQERFASEMRHKFLPKKTWESNEIAILCGRGFEEWSPKNIDQGIGGSEEAVIYLSKELAKLGWKITVYGDPGKGSGEYDGVTYLPYYDLNYQDDFNVLVLWRAVGFVDFNPKAKFTMLWLHDVPSNPDFTEERIKKIDKIAILSDYHKGLLRVDKGGKFEEMPLNKIFVTTNGIPEIDPPKIKRIPGKMIYSSSPDRGLVYLLQMWPEIIKAVPGATLDIYYGFETFDTIHGGNPGRMRWKERLIQMMKQPGVTYRGRVSHQALHTAFARSEVWAYPTDFTEISCITAMKAQRLGAIPVCTTKAALEETVRNGMKINVDITTEEGQKEYVGSLVNMLQDKTLQEEIREPMMEWAKGHFGWNKVAINWDRLFRVYIQNPQLSRKGE